MKKKQSTKVIKQFSIYDEYDFIQKEYESIYGIKKVVTLMMVGGFYEAYSVPSDNLDLGKIAELLNIVFTRTKKDQPVNKNNPNMIGFPLPALNKYVKVLVNNNYSVVVADQITSNTGKKVNGRKVVGVYSPGTFIDEIQSPDSNDIVLLYIEDEQQMNGDVLLCIGMSSIDISTGKCYTYEAISKNNDDKYALDEAFRFINGFNTREIVIYRKQIDNKKSMNKDKIFTYLELEHKKILYYTKIDKNIDKISYKNELFGKIFKNHGMLSPLEYLDLDMTQYAASSFALLVNFVYKHNESFINNISKPILYHDNKKLILGNNATHQLNIINNNGSNSKSLFDLLNGTSTAIGRRFLKESLQTPLTDINIIKIRYDLIDELSKNNFYINIENHLKNVVDIERIHRKISLETLHPYEIANMFHSYKEIISIFNLLDKNIYNHILPSDDKIQKCTDFVKLLEDTFDMSVIESYNLTNIDKSFFKPNNYKNIDALQHKIIINETHLNDICSAFTNILLLNDKKVKKKKESSEKDNLVIFDYSDKEGYYLKTSINRSKILKNGISKMQFIKINDELSIDVNGMRYKENNSGVKITSTEMDKISKVIMDYREEMVNLIYSNYKSWLSTIYDKYQDIFKEITSFVSSIDFLKSGAKIAIINNYIKPIVNKSKNGYIKCTGLRHPIVEKINDDIEYIPHNIMIGKQDNNETTGILLYGLNSSGKSTLMKSIGISVIMAQCGLFVPASSYEYSPYNLLFARITGNDDMYKGLSSYALELVEIRSILNRSGPKTLIIGDEICRGTEYISGNSIVASTIVNLSNTGSTFIFASHLHEIPKLKKISELKNLKYYHLSVEIDEDTNNLIFDRQLKEGQGTTMYGIIVARHIVNNNEFIRLAQEFKNELLDVPNNIVNNKKSKYNKNVYVHECSICGEKITNDILCSNIDTHHINEQKNCKNGYVINKPHLKKNSKANLVTLCKKCHNEEHRQKLTIKGYKKTSNGRVLDVEKK